MILIIAIGLLLAGVIQTERKYTTKPYKNVQVKVLPVIDQHFINEESILAYLTARMHELDNDTTLLHNIPTKTLENIIKTHNFVLHCSAYKHWHGNVTITIVPRKVLARMMHADIPDCYIDNEGVIIPLSPTYTPRVVLMESARKYSATDLHAIQPYGKSLLHMLQLFASDTFWHTQIIHIAINHQEEVTLTTKLGRHQVQLGTLYQWEDKLKRLKLFYEVILPAKGWGAYKVINLKFDSQIICE